MIHSIRRETLSMCTVPFIQKLFSFLASIISIKTNHTKPELCLTVTLTPIGSWLTQKAFRTAMVRGFLRLTSQWAFSCSKLTIAILEQGVKYVQS